jgi:hypothetical protein
MGVQAQEGWGRCQYKHKEDEEIRKGKRRRMKDGGGETHR